jgi:MoaA/NifB/PqqE/SkfB family radical SAM enzyme
VSRDEQQHLEEVIAKLLEFKRKKRGVIVSSDYYLEQVPRFFSGQMHDSCNSGVRTIHIDPAGLVRRCPDFPADFHWKEFKRYTPIDCNACYYACRGEAQAPLTIARVRDVMATTQ